MKFLTLKLNNWLVFRGQQQLQFPQDDHANILLIFGENMHGKTSLLNAVRWALYGEALDRQKRVVANEKLMNLDASKSGEINFSVNLELVADGKTYEIFRSAELAAQKPKVSLFLKENGRVQDGGSSQSKIEALVPKQISQFLLFDGELLNEFEQLVADEAGSQAKAIKKSIEQALGLPVLQRAIEELGALQKVLSKDFQSESKKNRNLEVLTRNLGIHENDLASKLDEKEGLERQIEDANIRIGELDVILERTNKDVALSEKKKLLSSELTNNRKELSQLEESLKVSMSSLWREPLLSALKPFADKLQKDISDLSMQRKSAEIAQGQLRDLEIAIDAGLCSLCGSELEAMGHVKIIAKLEGIKNDLVDVDELTRKISFLEQQLNGISFIEPGNNVSLKIFNDSDQKKRLFKRNIEIEDEIFEIRNQLADFDEENGRKIKAEYTIRSKEIGRITEQVLTVENDIEKIELEIGSIKRNPDYMQAGEEGSSKAKLDKCEALINVFKGAVSGYRESMRNKVGTRASQTFKNLTTEKRFDHLKINESYGLNLIVDGNQVARSAGAEQIIALSLIEALNFNGRRKGPMLMDTPAGRLDNLHRKNVMNYMPKVVTQLAFFAHSGELTDEDIYFDRSKIGKKYSIRRIGPFHSVLEQY